MSLTTIVFLVILLFFTWRGYQKGFIGAISRVLSFVIAYPAAIFFTKPFANFLRGYTSLDGLILFLVAGCIIFLGVSLAVTLLLNAMARLIPQTQFTETSSKVGGTVFGLVIGGVFGLIAVYIVDILVKPKTIAPEFAATQPEDARSKNQTAADEEAIKKYVVAEGAPAIDRSSDTFIDTTAKKLVSNAASTAVELITDDKATSQITKAITQDPQATLGHVQNMTNDGEFKALLNKPSFQAELNRGNVETLMNNKDFQQLMQNPDMQAIVSSDTDPSADKSGEQAAAEKMIQAWQKVSTLKNDPRVLAIVSDEAFQAQLNSPNKLSLLMNPKLRELTEIIFEPNPAGAMPQQLEDSATETEKNNMHYTIEDITNGPAQQHEEVADEDTKTSTEKKTGQPEQKLYRWTDENGKVHFSDKPVKSKP
ncbi:MAG: CvpA family protein [Cellvibrio sp.]